MVSLCDRCQNNFREFANEVCKPACEAAGCKWQSIWCGATDQPEEERWEYCPNFKEMTCVI